MHSKCHSRALFKICTLSTLIAASFNTHSAGFQLNAQSATGLGRAFAGDAVIADNASVMARNAAAMTLFDSHEFSGGVNVIDTNINISDLGGGMGHGVPDAQNGSTTPVPNIFYIHRLNDKVALGVGAYSNFGTDNTFSKDFGKESFGGMAGMLGGTTKIQSVNFTLNAAYRVNDHWSVGGGLDLVNGVGELKRPIASNSQAQLLDVDAEGWALGFNLGTVYELNKNNRFGLSYRYSPEVKASGKIEMTDPIFGSKANYSNQKLILPLPDMLEFSGYHKIEDTKFAVHYSLQWIGWNTFKSIKTDGGQINSAYNWKDGYHAAIGGTYYLNKSWTLRAGYMYDTSAQDKITSISVPDSDRQWFSTGLGYHFNKKHTIDFGFTFLMGKDVKVNQGTVPFDLTATTRADAVLAGLQYSYSFK
ncbi:outer membrane protein transport protein [Vibrio barjaei]|uniref:outer membrane protein transport protein n=1 Tax=Vibrio barjaei TaxID=1676683 RepID=UPI0022838545|nr:outer membrane protein transport protein [Vibrio barjaei]MCY9873847.1 outer membrane protein transport protein [Vibrio barjaei]